MTFWTNFFANKIGSGLELPGMSSALKGLIEKIAELNPDIIDVDKVKKLNSLAKKANLVGRIAELADAGQQPHPDANSGARPARTQPAQERRRRRDTKITWLVQHGRRQSA